MEEYRATGGVSGGVIGGEVGGMVGGIVDWHTTPATSSLFIQSILFERVLWKEAHSEIEFSSPVQNMLAI